MSDVVDDRLAEWKARGCAVSIDNRDDAIERMNHWLRTQEAGEVCTCGKVKGHTGWINCMLRDVGDAQ